ncbi:unnamed protein product [Periconia digitata]|uniref:Uncharacterized protein n=1 Tax=Periconia digitata TaxID=1303443 RepID=A0A9W4U4N1_9PLEO|nr:unnamed protein product [Periconia digitata]
MKQLFIRLSSSNYHSLPLRRAALQTMAWPPNDPKKKGAIAKTKKQSDELRLEKAQKEYESLLATWREQEAELKNFQDELEKGKYLQMVEEPIKTLKAWIDFVNDVRKIPNKNDDQEFKNLFDKYMQDAGWVEIFQFLRENPTWRNAIPELDDIRREYEGMQGGEREA